MKFTKRSTKIPTSLNTVSAAMRTSLILSAVGLFSLSSSLVQAQSTLSSPASSSDNKVGISAGLNVIVSNNAYDVDEKQVTVLPSIFFDNGKVYARGSQLGGYLINDDKNEVAGFIQPGGSVFDPDDANGALSELDEREWSGMAGVSYLRRTPYGGFRGQVATDLLGNSEGTTAKLTYLARLTPGKWTVYPSVGLEWVNEDYNQYYYGVSDKESNKSGVDRYSPDSSISPYVSLNATYDINQDWDLFLGQNVTYLADEQYDSPMVDDRVSYRTTLGVLYKF